MLGVEEKANRYRKYLQSDPDNDLLWISYGDALHEAGDFPGADEAFSKALELKPDNAVAKSRLASLAISCQRFVDAENMLAALLRSGCKDDAIILNLGMALFYQRRFDEAKDIFQTLSDSEIVGEEASYFFVACLHNLGLLEEAIAHAELAMQKHPSSKMGGYLALIYMDSANMEKAMQQAGEILKSDPDNVDAASVIGTYCIEQQSMEQAEEYFRHITVKEKNNIRGWQGLSLIALYEQNYDSAIEYIAEAIRYDPDNLGNHNLCGWIRVVRKEFSEAESEFKKSIAINRNNADAHGGLAVALAMQSKVDASKREVEVALRLDRNCFGALYARGIILELHGKHQSAAKVVGSIFQSSPRQDGKTVMDSLVEYFKKNL